MTESIVEPLLPRQPTREVGDHPSNGRFDDDPSARKQEARAVQRTLTDTYGAPGHLRQDQRRHLPHADVVAYGIAGEDDHPGRYDAAVVSQASGTMVVAASSGTRVSADTVAQGFTRAMEAGRTSTATLKAGVGHVQTTLGKTLPAMIHHAHSFLRSDIPESKPTTTTAQLVGNQLVYSGRPILYNPDSGACERLADAPPDKPRVHTLPPGPHVIIMGSGITGEDESVRMRVGSLTREALNRPASDTSSENAAARVAESIRDNFAQDGPAGKVLASIVEVTPWRDRRPGWQQKSDYVARAPSTLAYWGASRVIGARSGRQAAAQTPAADASPPVSPSRRELYETNSRSGRFGRAAAYVADIALAGYVAYALIGGVAHHEAPPPRGQPVTVSAPAPETPGPVIKLGPPVPIIPPPTEHAPKPFPGTYIALSHDPHNGGKASTIISIKNQMLSYYGRQAGLPAADIANLIHDHRDTTNLVHTFVTDHSNHNNLLAAAAPYELNAGDPYSTRAMAAAERRLVNTAAHSDVPTAQTTPTTNQPETPPAIDIPSPLPTTPDSLASLPALPKAEQHTDTSKWPAWTIGAIGLLGIGIAGIGGKKMRDRHHLKDALQELGPDGAFVRPHGRNDKGIRNRRYRLLKEAGHLPPDDEQTQPRERVQSQPYF